LRKIAHIVNPFNAPRSSDLHFAQPITFESMRVAKKKVEGKIEIELLYTTFAEDSNIEPIGFNRTSFLNQSVLDCGNFQKKIKLPLIHDILERLFNASNAEYLIYTNVDIGLYENFYEKVNEFIDAGHDAFIINRRRISEKYKRVDQLAEIYKEKGKKHPGFDCFVFHRDLYPKLELKGICIGVPFIEITFAQNLFALSKNFKLFDQEQLTFHIGMEIFKKRAPKEYFRYNQKQFWSVVNSSLRKHITTRKFPYNNLFYPFRIIRWGLHPCIPIRLVIRLEWERFQNQFRLNK
jgi:hypothetical protein